MAAVVFVVVGTGLGIGAGRWAAVDLVSGRLGLGVGEDKAESAR
jgi:hypothetical protein